MPRRFGLVRVRSPLLTESLLLSSPGGNEMFQFPPLAAAAYGFGGGRFGHPGINARLTAPPGLSQSSTPFLASWRQDIPHTPLLAWPHSPRPREAANRPGARGKTSQRPRPCSLSQGGALIHFSLSGLVQSLTLGPGHGGRPPSQGPRL